MNIYVGNLNYNLTPEELEKLFAEYGEVSETKIIKDKQTGKAKGFGFIEMPNSSEAEDAINELNGAEVMGRNIVVRKAKPATTQKREYSNFRSKR